MVEVEVRGMGAEVAGGAPLLVLQERHGQRRCLPIWVGDPEAVALTAATQGAAAPRPLTHRLLLDMLDAFAVVLGRVRVTALVDGQFHAELDLAGPATGSAGPVSVSARASDAVALALHCGCGIEVAEAVLDAASLPAARVAGPQTADTAAGGADPPAIEDQVAQLRQALTDASPEDFERPDSPGGPE